MLSNINWMTWAGRLNQASLIPFLLFLWTLSRIPNAPKKAVRAWYLYLVFIAVAIPAGIYSKTHLGTSMANVDWLHGPCEALLTVANLFIVLGFRDAIRELMKTTQDNRIAAATDASSSSTAATQQSFHAHASGEALSDMQYMQQLHEVYRAEHGSDAGVPAAAQHVQGFRSSAAGHVQGFGSAAKQTDLVDLGMQMRSGESGSQISLGGSDTAVRAFCQRKQHDACFRQYQLRKVPGRRSVPVPATVRNFSMQCTHGGQLRVLHGV